MQNNSEKKTYKLIACEVLFREVCSHAATSNNVIDITFVRKGLHDIGAEKMSKALQQEIDAVNSEDFDAILLCYGLCSNGVTDLHADIPIVIPRAHDCITLFLGSKERYRKYFDENPGTYFKSPGWVERGNWSEDAEDSITSQLGLKRTYEEYVELYGEEDAQFIFETLGGWEESYKKVAFINTGLGNIESYRNVSTREAEENNWEYEEVEGDTRLIGKLLNGEWDENEFLVIPKGNTIHPSSDENIVKCVARVL